MALEGREVAIETLFPIDRRSALDERHDIAAQLDQGRASDREAVGDVGLGDLRFTEALARERFEGGAGALNGVLNCWISVGLGELLEETIDGAAAFQADHVVVPPIGLRSGVGQPAQIHMWDKIEGQYRGFLATGLQENMKRSLQHPFGVIEKLDEEADLPDITHIGCALDEVTDGRGDGAAAEKVRDPGLGAAEDGVAKKRQRQAVGLASAGAQRIRDIDLALIQEFDAVERRLSEDLKSVRVFVDGRHSLEYFARIDLSGFAIGADGLRAIKAATVDGGAQGFDELNGGTEDGAVGLEIGAAVGRYRRVHPEGEDRLVVDGVRTDPVVSPCQKRGERSDLALRLRRRQAASQIVIDTAIEGGGRGGTFWNGAAEGRQALGHVGIAEGGHQEFGEACQERHPAERDDERAFAVGDGDRSLADLDRFRQGPGAEKERLERRCPGDAGPP